MKYSDLGFFQEILPNFFENSRKCIGFNHGSTVKIVKYLNEARAGTPVPALAPSAPSDSRNVNFCFPIRYILLSRLRMLPGFQLKETQNQNMSGRNGCFCVLELYFEFALCTCEGLHCRITERTRMKLTMLRIAI